MVRPLNSALSEVISGQSAIFQSYPEGKYVGGEAFKPGDTKCDLTVCPPDVDLADQIQQLISDPMTTILYDREVLLQSGEPGMRFELESLGRYAVLFTEVGGRAIVLTCFGELGPFDDIAFTIRSLD